MQLPDVYVSVGTVAVSDYSRHRKPLPDSLARRELGTVQGHYRPILLGVNTILARACSAQPWFPERSHCSA